MLSKRLFEISTFIEDDKSILDVGCDHALLGIYLTLYRNNIRVMATDISKKVLKGAYNNILKFNVKEKIKLKLSKGLNDLVEFDFDYLVIAGIGGRKTIKILDESKLKQIKKIIVQPTNNIYEVRKHMVSVGYMITKESIVKEKNKVYTIILFEKGIGNYSELDLLLGPCLIKEKNKLLVYQIDKEINNINMYLYKNRFKFIQIKHHLFKQKLKKIKSTII